MTNDSDPGVWEKTLQSLRNSKALEFTSQEYRTKADCSSGKVSSSVSRLPHPPPPGLWPSSFSIPKIWRGQCRARKGGLAQFSSTFEHQYHNYNLTNEACVMSFHSMVGATLKKKMPTHSWNPPVHHHVTGSHDQASIRFWETPKAGAAHQYMASPIQVSGTTELRATISCSESLMKH